ncbi:MAG: carbohydrate ABC transporter permease [Verrucomicrobia bacterium]|nr:carbohydrate ABC transporter permease [Verrucomicrobiota bacterium]
MARDLAGRHFPRLHPPRSSHAVPAHPHSANHGAYIAQSLPPAIWLLAAYFQSIPRDLEEAARIDGASAWRFYTSILFPIAKPAIATVVVITCLNTWNEFLLAMLLVLDPMKKTLPAGMIAFEAAHSTFYPALLAGLTLISVPTLMVYALFNRQVMRGMVAGAVKS